MGTEMVTYQGAQVEKQDAKKIDRIIEDLQFIAYKEANKPLNDVDIDIRRQLENELRHYGKKYNDLAVGWWLTGGK